MLEVSDQPEQRVCADSGVEVDAEAVRHDVNPELLTHVEIGDLRLDKILGNLRWRRPETKRFLRRENPTRKPVKVCDGPAEDDLNGVPMKTGVSVVHVPPDAKV